MFKKITFLLLILSPFLNSQIISEELVKRHITVLSSDLMEGRKAGTEGIEKAAQYIEKEFGRIGLKKYGALKTYRQNFNQELLKKFKDIQYPIKYKKKI